MSLIIVASEMPNQNFTQNLSGLSNCSEGLSLSITQTDPLSLYKSQIGLPGL